MDRAGGPATGLNRTGKSCRLRWVNYLHPGLKHGRMTPQEERLVLELHSELGNRWSRIARRLPGRTDNEIKNYWRTHMRKMAQERRNASCSSSTPTNYLSAPTQPPSQATAVEKHDGGISSCIKPGENEDDVKFYPIDKIWNEINTSEFANGSSFDHCTDDLCNVPSDPIPMASPLWEFIDQTQWKMEDNEFMIPPMNDLPSLSSRI
ncbi:hypothetical protein HPP92_014319 [Vanilla planifolia]|uniref:Uncharacterized protein n=1 Tax=Vanilla planifolia TaxID=51239 RepID=A0A835QTB1_VANPL|nr:hypothetical protein HPP92_014319 [Vanilla planifolia]